MNLDGLRRPWPFGEFLFGLLMLVLAAIGIATGKAYGKGGRSADRTKESVNYWTTILIQFLVGVFLICASINFNPR